MRILFTFLILLCSPFAQAFNEGKCGDIFPKSGDAHPPYYSPFYTITMMPSTTSYISSWGKCSMYGDISENRVRFIATNQYTLKAEAARGYGELLSSLAYLSGCDLAQEAQFGSSLRENFMEVFADNNPEKISRQIDQLQICKKS